MICTTKYDRIARTKKAYNMYGCAGKSSEKEDGGIEVCEGMWWGGGWREEPARHCPLSVVARWIVTVTRLRLYYVRRIHRSKRAGTGEPSDRQTPVKCALEGNT